MDAMHKALFLMLLLAGAALVTVEAARADDSFVEPPGAQTSSSKLMGQYVRGPLQGASAVHFDTTWVGYSATNHAGPQNYWNVYAGVSRPGVADPNNAVWDFEHLANAHGDSLMGWWPTNDRAPVLGSVLGDDHVYAYACLDFGNGTNNVNPGTGSQRRTWGVVGAWHADPGRNAGVGVTWAPISGGKSAWCGLRQHGDLSVMDPVTHNPYNSDCADFIVQNCGQTVKNFPGYVRQWDQMLYRDLTPVMGQPLALSFLYRTRLSTAYTPGAGRRGWFHGDPLATTNANFISAFAQAGPIDSFSVYIGVPVDDANVTLSTGAVAPVYDPQRRWFSEVLRIWDGVDAPYYELLGQTGVNPADTTGSVAFSAMIPWTAAAGLPQIATIANSPLQVSGSHDVRLVFRVKTNDTGDDLTSSTWGELGGRGAAQVDDVTIQWGAGAPVVIGDFEGAEGDPGNVNNAIGASPETYWKSTGKPPALYFHARPLAGLPWNDLCGQVGALTHKCGMAGNVLDAGNDPTEMIGDANYDAGLDGFYGALSPTIDLTTTTSPNPMGLTSANVVGTDDYYVAWDVYAGDFNADMTGVFYYYGCASYPNRQAGTGATVWGDVVTSPAVYYSNDPLCYRDLLPLKARSMVVTSNATGVPDSLRIWIGIYNFPLWWGECTTVNPSDGAYFDNVSFAIVNRTGGAAGVGPISSDIWQWFNDAFPVGGPALGAGTSVAALDTCGALIKGARNIAQLEAVSGLGVRLDVLADSIVVAAPDMAVGAGDTNSTHVRVDMVFRILPGPGNYRAQSGLDTLPKYPIKLGMHLLRRPDDRTTLVDPDDGSDHSFWAEYIRNPGEFASGSHTLDPLSGKLEWNSLAWNSARCDTQETNQFPTQVLTSVFPVRAGRWQSTYHESDPRLAVLGIARPRCFVVDTLAAEDLSSSNIVCGSAPAWLAALPQSRTGWDGTLVTVEGTKIIPDGLLTPGAHVEYFFRKSQVFQHGGYAMCPDTQTILPQLSESNFDGHRWQQISILPDRWKDTQFGGSGMACMLYLDYDNRRGDELVWTSVMDSIGGTQANRWGSHNGWHSAGGVSLNGLANPNLQAQAFVYKNAQPGALWDKYSVRGAESGRTVGVRLGGRLVTHGADRLEGHDAQVAPTPAMLKQYYTSIGLLTGDLNSSVLGPRTDMPEDDLAILSDFLTSGSGLTSKPRAMLAAGSGFAESENNLPMHRLWMATQLGVSLVNPSYAALASNNNACTDLRSTSIISAYDIYGVGLGCSETEDVIQHNPSLPGSQNVSFYENTGAGPYAASVYHQRQPANDPLNYVSLVDGFDLANMWGRYCATSYGRLARSYNVWTKAISQVCNPWGPHGGYGDVPQPEDGHLADYMKIGNSVGPARTATINFGVASTGRVRVRLYDVSGRVVRTLTDRTYAASDQMQTLHWDGLDGSGHVAARGVYFARIDYGSGAAISGRVVVLR
jgi:hypothetical protein